MNTSPFAQDVEKDLLQRAQRGDRRALGEIYRIYSSSVYTLAKRFFPQGVDAEDVLQETFITAFEKLQQFRGESAFGFWLRGIAVNKSLMRIRANKANPVIFMEVEYDNLPVAEGVTEVSGDIERQLARLNEVSRAVLWLHDVEGYTHKEIAALMDKSVSFSKSQLARAHQKLRGWLKCHEPVQKNIQIPKR